MIGAGYVGLVSGACLSEFGSKVTCVDKDINKIERLERGEVPIYEPGLDGLISRNVHSERLSFSTDLESAVADSDAVFISVGTPMRQRGDGHANIQYIYDAAEQIATCLDGYTVIVMKSTVPVGTSRKIKDLIKKKCPYADFDIASNPEFLREGSAIGDFMRPDRVVVGYDSDRAREVIHEIYRPLFLAETPVLYTDLETAELTKYASNAFLATKIAFINEMSDICEKVGANVQDVAKGMGLDRRIGPKFLHAGPGYGGSCFPKDTCALKQISEEQGTPSMIVKSVIEANEARKYRMADRIIEACGGSVSGKCIAVLGLTFKPNTDDMREAPSLTVIPDLIKSGAQVRGHDPKAVGIDRLPASAICYDSAYETMKDADALVILTEWNEFRALDMDRVLSLLSSPTLIDFRNIYDPKYMVDKGFDYHSVGRPRI